MTIENPIVYQDKIIDNILRHNDSYVINRLFDQYITSGDQDAFVMALIGKVMIFTKQSKKHL